MKNTDLAQYLFWKATKVILVFSHNSKIPILTAISLFSILDPSPSVMNGVGFLEDHLARQFFYIAVTLIVCHATFRFRMIEMSEMNCVCKLPALINTVQGGTHSARSAPIILNAKTFLKWMPSSSQYVKLSCREWTRIFNWKLDWNEWPWEVNYLEWERKEMPWRNAMRLETMIEFLTNCRNTKDVKDWLECKGSPWKIQEKQIETEKSSC